MGRDRGKEEKFEELYQQYRNAVYRISLHYTKNEQEAQDIAQKTFFAFYLRMDKIKLECAREYLFRTAKNLSYNWLRDTKREREGECEEYECCRYKYSSRHRAFIESKKDKNNNNYKIKLQKYLKS